LPKYLAFSESLLALSLQDDVTALIGEPCRIREIGDCEGKQMLNRTLEIGHGVVGCTQSQGPELDEDLS